MDTVSELANKYIEQCGSAKMIPRNKYTDVYLSTLSEKRRSHILAHRIVAKRNVSSYPREIVLVSIAMAQAIDTYVSTHPNSTISSVLREAVALYIGYNLSGEDKNGA